ncbi:hypothetical protein DY000_02033240 [Brassica cretica]|uniref:Glabrous enhancer-binding protein-like C-terminal domain-containing protein n=1 Tax=Brassica cretica TaxID=69181 RepID=A0ABQ7DKV5_BRACR|nr:hypothetical protein DY000_02033240 [Brassica cretica]
MFFIAAILESGGDELMSVDMVLLDSDTTFMPATISANRVQILSSSAGEKEIEFEPEGYQPRSSVKVQLSERKLLVGGDSRNFKEKLQTMRRKYTTTEIAGIAFQSANGKSKESKKRVTTKPDLVSSRNGKNAQDGSKREDMENSFFLGMNFLKAKWTMMPTETKKETQEKMKKLHANELECEKN